MADWSAVDPLQPQVQRAVRQILAREADGDWWAELAELGAFAFGVPAADGGLDLGQRCLVLVAEELGRALLASPALDTMLAADALVLAGPGTPQRSKLAAIADGRLRVAAAGLAPPAPGLLRLDAGLDGGQGGALVSGRGLVAAFPHEADELLLAVGTGSPAPRLFLVPAARPGWAFRLLETAIPAGLASLSLAGLELRPEDELATPGAGPLLGRGRLRQAAYLLGLAAAAHDAAVAHAHRRRQFGQALIEFQGVGFPLAALAGRLEAARLSVQHAAWLDDSGRPSLSRATECLAMSAELALDATRAGIQVHGALGMTGESPAQRQYRAALLETARWGRPADLWREAGRARLEAAATADPG